MALVSRIEIRAHGDHPNAIDLVFEEVRAVLEKHFGRLGSFGETVIERDLGESDDWSWKGRAKLYLDISPDPATVYREITTEGPIAPS